MDSSRLGVRWIKMASVYLLLGVGLGIHMGKSHEFTLMPVHAHLNLLGWASMALMGVLHHVFAKQLVNRIAVVQFWLHQVATPVLLVSLTLYLGGNAGIEPVVGISSMVVGVAVLLFTYNVLRNLQLPR